ncbi:WD40 repeat [Reichenbachiella faecimaris]|uniref:WD40 repeat n=1 Tax=Reichenbachiella faecimaris TaxID=692418 RepID=A0A1W2G4W2_REIFA|nr:caspase family protein [Reichenbachiella faecimaris]SMD31729.1 WD40 repeat [Reichenbachiella faecimaris]
MKNLLILVLMLSLPILSSFGQTKKVAELEDNSGEITEFQVDENNQYIAIGNEIGILTVFDFSTKEELYKIRPHKEKIKFIRFYSGQNQVVSFTDSEIVFSNASDGAQISKISLFEKIDWVDLNNSSQMLYLLSTKGVSDPSKRIYKVELQSRKFDVFHASTGGIGTFKTSYDGKLMYLAKGDEILVKNIDLDIIDKKLKGHEANIEHIDLNPSKTDWMTTTDKYSLRFWKISSGKSYLLKWKAVPTPEDFDKLYYSWVLNQQNKILIHGEEGLKIRDVSNPHDEVSIISSTGLKIEKVALSPDKSSILIQSRDNSIEVWSSGEAPQIASNDTNTRSTETTTPVINSSDEIYKKYKVEIDKELNLRAELYKPRGEFERTTDYEARLDEAETYKEGIFDYYRDLANREAEVAKELEAARLKILAEREKRDSERRAALFRDKIKGSYQEYYTRISELGTYNADTEEFPITIDGMTHSVKVPFDKARAFKQNSPFFKVVGNSQLLDDAVTLEKFNYKIVTDSKEVYEFGKQKKALFVADEADLLLNGLIKPTQATAAATPVVSRPATASPETEESELDSRIVDYFSTKTYHALLIGVDEYRDPSITQLDGPIADAGRLKDVLTRNYTFEEENITFLQNPTRTEIIETFDELQSKIDEEDNLLIFYAGHGVWDEDLKQGFWLPSDAKRTSKAAWLSNAMIRDYIGGIHTKHTLLVADACFSGGIFKTRDMFIQNMASLELAKLPSRKAITSGAMKTVPDKSVFIEYLTKRLEENERSLLPAEILFSSFKIAVMNNSHGQVPQFGDIKGAGDEGGDFIFLKR